MYSLLTLIFNSLKMTFHYFQFFVWFSLKIARIKFVYFLLIMFFVFVVWITSILVYLDFSCFYLVYGKSFLFCWKFSPVLRNNVPKSVFLVIKHYLRWMFWFTLLLERGISILLYDILLLYKKCVLLQCLHFVWLFSFAISILKFLFSICWFYALQLRNCALFCS